MNIKVKHNSRTSIIVREERACWFILRSIYHTKSNLLNIILIICTSFYLQIDWIDIIGVVWPTKCYVVLFNLIWTNPIWLRQCNRISSSICYWVNITFPELWAGTKANYAINSSLIIKPIIFWNNEHTLNVHIFTLISITSFLDKNFTRDLIAAYNQVSECRYAWAGVNIGWN